MEVSFNILDFGFSSDYGFFSIKEVHFKIQNMGSWILNY